MNLSSAFCCGFVSGVFWEFSRAGVSRWFPRLVSQIFIFNFVVDLVSSCASSLSLFVSCTVSNKWSKFHFLRFHCYFSVFSILDLLWIWQPKTACWHCEWFVIIRICKALILSLVIFPYGENLIEHVCVWNSQKNYPTNVQDSCNRFLFHVLSPHSILKQKLFVMSWH